MFRRMTGALFGLCLAASPLAAQAFDEPSFLAPRPGEDLGVYWTTQGDYGVHGIWRTSGLGVRGGWVSNPGGNNAFLVGAEAFTRLLRQERGMGFDLAVTGGAGATFAGDTELRVAAGLSAGIQLPLAGFIFQPYAHPRVALDVHAHDDNLHTSFSLPTDLGADMLVGEGFTIRFGTVLGENVYGLGVALQLGRGVAVR